MSEAQVYAFVTYARTGPASWMSHLDLMRTMERALVRAHLPLVWRGGYNPRPDLAFALPVGVGVETRRDPFLVSLASAVDAEVMKARWNAVLPDGLTIVSVTVLAERPPSLMLAVREACYRLVGDDLTPLADVLAGDGPLWVAKRSKRGLRSVDLRPGVVRVRREGRDLLVDVVAGASDNVRIDLLLKAAADSVIPPYPWSSLTIIREAVVLDFEPV